MPFILATSTELNESEWGGAIRVPDIPWRADGPYLNINGKEILAGETAQYYFEKGYNCFLPSDHKHELSADQIAQIPEKVTYHFNKPGPPDICGVGGCELNFKKNYKC